MLKQIKIAVILFILFANCNIKTYNMKVHNYTDKNINVVLAYSTGGTDSINLAPGGETNKDSGTKCLGSVYVNIDNAQKDHRQVRSRCAASTIDYHKLNNNYTNGLYIS